MRRYWMILLQDAVNIVCRIRSDQNVRNRKGNNQSQRDSRPSHHETKSVASSCVPVKEHEGRESTFSPVALRDPVCETSPSETSLAGPGFDHTGPP